MSLRQWTVDAFASEPFRGNPACVVEPFDAWPSDGWVQALAQENNQAETAFLLRTADPARFGLRWCTPTMEVPFCGHATLGAAHVLFSELGVAAEEVVFETRFRGEFRVRRTGEGYRLGLADGRHIEADLVLSAIGLRPDLALARTAGIDTGCGIKVDAHLRTSVPGIFALGDCIEIDGQVLPYLAPINQGIQALAKTLLGQAAPVTYPAMPVTVKTPAMPLCFLAPPPGTSGEWRCTRTGTGLTAGFHDTRGVLRGFVLLGHEAQAQRGAWLNSCHDGQRAVA